jgi:hypothetical protein
MGLNQAAIVVKIENRGTGLVWKNLMAKAEVCTMFDKLDAAT